MTTLNSQAIDFKPYIGTKKIDAAPMTLGDYNLFRGWQIPKDEDPGTEGYVVQYPDGYISWSPKNAFEEAYRIIDFLDGLGYQVFPSKECTLSVQSGDEYHGAHRYVIQNSLGFSDGQARYDDSFQYMQFVQKNHDGSMIPGVQSEQLAYILYDRVEKLNRVYPSEQNKKMMDGLQMFLDACKERIEDRMDRGVMGDLKK